MSIFELEQPAEQPIPELVAIIRQLLTDAESGEVRAFAYTSIHRVGPGDTWNEYAQEHDMAQLELRVGPTISCGHCATGAPIRNN